MKRVVITLVWLVMAGGCTQYAPVTITSMRVPDSSPKAIAIANKYAGFKATPAPSFWYEDSSKLTEPSLSFKLKAEPSNQDVLFIVLDDMSPVNHLENFIGKPPFTSARAAANIEQVKVDENFQWLGNVNLHWFVGRYKENGKDLNVLVGAFPSRVSGKSVLVVSKALDISKNSYDYRSTLWLCDQMCSAGGQK